MTKKNFIGLADALLPVLEDRPGVHLDMRAEKIVEAVADFCAAQNPKFKRKRWLAYLNGTAGLGGGAVKAAPTVRAPRVVTCSCGCGATLPDNGRDEAGQLLPKFRQGGAR